MDDPKCYFFYFSFETLPVRLARLKMHEVRKILEGFKDVDFIHTFPGDGKTHQPYTTFYLFAPRFWADTIFSAMEWEFETKAALTIDMLDYISKSQSDWSPPPSVRRAAIEEEAEAIAAGADLNRKQRRILDALYKKALEREAKRKEGVPDGNH